MLGKQKAKYIQSLGQKKQRDAEGLFIAEGPKIVSELIQTFPQYIQEVYAVKEWIKENDHLHTKSRDRGNGIMNWKKYHS
ncbi:MAG: hypothetical protein WDO71_18475 [Bacteroidota bacterium]